jgi:hypothetical protein
MPWSVCRGTFRFYVPAPLRHKTERGRSDPADGGSRDTHQGIVSAIPSRRGDDRKLLPSSDRVRNIQEPSRVAQIGTPSSSVCQAGCLRPELDEVFHGSQRIPTVFSRSWPGLNHSKRGSGISYHVLTVRLCHPLLRPPRHLEHHQVSGRQERTTKSPD